MRFLKEKEKRRPSYGLEYPPYWTKEKVTERRDSKDEGNM